MQRTIELPILEEVHTSDIQGCARRVQHRILGEFDPSVPTAMFRGLLAGASLERVHNEHRWEPDLAPEAVALALVDTKAKMVSEGRSLTDGAIKNLDQTVSECIKMCGFYIERWGKLFKRCVLIGCELPIRWEMEHPILEEPVKFASHLDLMFRDTTNALGMGENRLHLWDWKWHKQSPSYAYLIRNMQMACYYVATGKGAILRNEKHDIWEQPKEYPVVSWVHLPALMPYMRKTVTKGSDGEEKVFLKGDERPADRIVRSIGHSPEMVPHIETNLAQHVLSMRHGIFLPSPDPVGCSLCPSEQWCQRYDYSD